MLRIAFINANLCEDPYPVYPLGMALLSGALARAGHEVQQHDLLAAGGAPLPILDALRCSKPDLVCLSIRNMDNVDSLAVSGNCRGLDLARRIIGEIRMVCDAPMIAGGSGFSIAAEAALDYIGADYGVAGEGEQLLVELAGALSAGGSIPRISIANRSPMNLDDLPEPLHDPALMRFYREKSGILNVQTKRGCPMHCAYCTYPMLEGASMRFWQPNRVVEELRRLHRDFGVDNVFMTDSIFNDPRGEYKQLAEALIRADVPVRWGAYFTPFRLTAEDLALCKRAKLYAAELGTDAASDATLAGMRKAFDWEAVRRATEAFARTEIPCAQFVMFGGPGETMETLEEGLRNIQGLPRTIVFGFSGVRAFPGTAIRTQGVAEGLFPADASPLDPIYYVSPGVNKEAMDQRIATAWAGHRDRVFPPEEGARTVRMLRAFGHKGLLWDKLLDQDRVDSRAARRRQRKRE